MNQVLLLLTFTVIKAVLVVIKSNLEKNMGDKLVSKQPKKRDIFSKYITFIKTIFENGNGMSLSELRDMLNQNEKVVFNNSEIK